MSTSRYRDRRTALAIRLAVGSSLLMAGAAWAQFAHKPQLETDADLQVTVAGQVVSIDPKTGRLRPPSPQQHQSLLETLRRITEPTEPPGMIVHPNGMLSVEMPETFDEVTMARIQPDGTLSFECVESDRVAEALCQAPAVKSVAQIQAVARTSCAAKPALHSARTAKRTAVPVARATAAKKPTATLYPDR